MHDATRDAARADRIEGDDNQMAVVIARVVADRPARWVTRRSLTSR